MFLGLGWNVWAALIGGVAFAVWLFWPSLSALPGKFKWPSTPTTTEPTTDSAKAFEAVKLLVAYYKNNPPALSAARTCGQHLFDEHTGGA